MVVVNRYTQDRKCEWDDFVSKSKNGTFLFLRDYMDYHSDRFCDCSLMFRQEGKLVGLLPANIKDDTLYSHQGLTYGGLVIGCRQVTSVVIEMFEALRLFLAQNRIRRVVYKALPWIYCTQTSDEPLYAMHTVFRNYRIAERDVSSVIDMHNALKWRESRKYGLRNAAKNGLKVEFSKDFAAFWPILSDNLLQKHDAKPVHTLEEITLLNNRFPDNVLLVSATKDGVMVGGIVAYVTSQVVHTQYISATQEGKRMGAVDAAVDFLLHGFQKQRYLDFGKSTEADSYTLNRNLLFQKEGFGARALCYDTYEWINEQ
jgi:hypothetical protein